MVMVAVMQMITFFATINSKPIFTYTLFPFHY